ncbi:MAG: hypothetical protein KZQ86_00655 [Candidatus Thiodiazotropha sp. (ex Lucinoma kastoroae)]|nr:hypothetical protein [Candidatus Thiodiazotropha sp. (ex Lucinoma kastoroae)]
MNSRVSSIFDGNSIIHAAITNSDRMAFITKEEPSDSKRAKLGDDQLATCVVYYNKNANWDAEKHHFGYKGWSKGMRRAYVVFPGKNSLNNLVFCGVEGSGRCTMAEGPDDDVWFEKSLNIIKPFDNHKAMLTATNIDGEVYFGGNIRKLYKRTDKNEWVDLTDENEHPNLHEDVRSALDSGRSIRSVPVGFDAIDGYSKSDIYGCGDGGDLWHFSGKNWRRLAPPVNFDMECIVCAGDGNVYIGGAMGGLIRGRFDPETGHEQWEEIKTPLSGSESRFTSLAWFQNRLYLGNDWALYHLTAEDKVEKVAFPKGGATQYSFQYVTACDTALLSYGPHQALVFDGEKWEQIVGVIEIPQ